MSIDLEKIRAIPIEYFLLDLGYPIKRKTTANIFFDSPFRKERTASFSVWTKKNRWKDFGSGEGGDIIQLAQKIWNLSFQDAIQKLDTKTFSASSKINPILPKADSIQLKKIVEIVSNKALIQYMEARSLQPQKLTGLVGEIYYLRNNKNYFGLAFKNDLGGYEIRNKYFKGCYGQKHFSTIQKGFASIIVFEGFIDFLSLASHKDIQSDILILNSCALVEKAMDTINRYDKAYLMLDNDKAGNETTALIQANANVKTSDLRRLYSEFKDVNDWIATKY